MNETEERPLSPEQLERVGELVELGRTSLADMLSAVRQLSVSMSGVRILAVRRVMEELPTPDAMRWSPEDVRPDTPAVR
jgi:hypothetical protein